MKKYIKGLLALLNKLCAAGTLNNEDKIKLLRCFKTLEHAIKTRDIKRIERSVDEFCRTIINK